MHSQRQLAKVNRLAPELDYIREKAILLGNECERLTGENENYKNDLEKLKEHIANLESIEGEVGELRRQIDNIIYEKDDLISILHDRDAQMNAMYEDLNRLTALEKDIEHIVPERDNLINMLNERDEQIVGLSDDLNKLQEDLNHATSELERPKSDGEGENKELQKLKDHISELENVGGELGDLRKHLDNITREKDDLAHILQERDTQIAAINDERKSLDNTLQAKNAEIDELDRKTE